MSMIIGVMGQSGHGKTTAMRTLDPSVTYYIDADKKGLSWQGWNHQYNTQKNNYAKESGVSDVWKLILSIAENRPEIKNIIVDTVNAIMLDDEMTRMKEKGYDKWVELSQCVYHMISESNTLRDDLIIVFVFWEQDRSSEDDSHFYHFLTSGKKLEKIVLENKFPMVLRAVCKDGNFVFETQANNSTAKSPMGLFNTLDVPNDMALVINALRAYMQAEPLPTGDVITHLIELMAADGIANYQLMKYCSDKGFIDAETSIADFPVDLISQLLVPDNWQKAKIAMGKVDNPNIEATNLSPEAKEIRALMQVDHIAATELRVYLLGKQFITPLQKWYETDPAILAQMAKPGNWDVVSNKIITNRK